MSNFDTNNVWRLIASVAIAREEPAYVVGGFVRDALLERVQKKDIDVVVEGSGTAFAEDFAALFDEQRVRLVPFEEFDTARVVFVYKDDEGGTVVDGEVEFAGARTEIYDDASRKPNVQATDLAEDLRRRDFTVNAMAREVTLEGLGVIIDPFDGQVDLVKKILRTPLDPDETFTEDPLRMMRAARFAAQLHFSIDEEAVSAMARNAERLQIVSMERITDELMKLLATETPSVGLWTLYETNVLHQFLPEIEDLAGVEEVKGYSHKDNLSHTFAVVDNIAEQIDDHPLLRYAGLMHDIAKPATKKFVKGRGWTFDMHEHLGRKMVRDIGQRLRMSKKDTAYVAKLVRWHLQPIALMDDGVTDTPVRRLIVNLGDDLQDLLILCRGDITTGNQKKKRRRLRNYDYLQERIKDVIEKDKLRAFQSPMRGEEIIEKTGLHPGPTIGKIKTAIEDAILDGVIPNEYDAACAYFEEIKGGYIAEAAEWEKN